MLRFAVEKKGWENQMSDWNQGGAQPPPPPGGSGGYQQPGPPGAPGSGGYQQPGSGGYQQPGYQQPGPPGPGGYPGGGAYPTPPPSTGGGSKKPLLIVGGIVVAIIVVIIGAAVVFGDDAERDEEGNITEAGQEDVFDLQVGDCWNDPAETEMSSVSAVPCSEPHDAEVFHEFDIPDADSYPGETTVTEQADAGCYAEFESFVGIAPESSSLGVYYLYPTQQSWDELDDRTVSCMITDPAGPNTGTLAGAAR